MALQLNGLDPSGSGSGGGTLIGTYSTLDTLAAVQAAGYFNEAASVLRWTNFLFVNADDGRALLGVDVDDAIVSVSLIVQEGGEPAPVEVSWDDVTDKPETFPPEIGTTADTALAGNTVIPPALTPGTAVADATDETDVVDQLNALLASLRGNGVIAT